MPRRERRTPVKLEVDHITALHDGGEALDPDNLQTLCSPCHSRKTARDNANRRRARKQGLPMPTPTPRPNKYQWAPVAMSTIRRDSYACVECGWSPAGQVRVAVPVAGGD